MRVRGGAQITPGAVRQNRDHFSTSTNSLFSQYSRAICAHFLAGKSHPAHQYRFNTESRRSNAIEGQPLIYVSHGIEIHKS
jgi:hypothetical protein